jgi:hypothetical protein
MPSILRTSLWPIQLPRWSLLSYVEPELGYGAGYRTFQADRLSQQNSHALVGNSTFGRIAVGVAKFEVKTVYTD